MPPEAPGEKHVSKSVDPQRLSELEVRKAVVVAEVLAPDVVSVRIELHEENVVRAGADQRAWPGIR